jgi:hypothetical protein
VSMMTALARTDQLTTRTVTIGSPDGVGQWLGHGPPGSRKTGDYQSDWTVTETLPAPI